MSAVPRIFTLMPFAADMNLGRAYNQAMELLPDDAWGVLMDHDAIWTTRNWHNQIAEAIAFKPDAGAFIACANRIGAKWQRAGDAEVHDIAHHRRFGAERMKHNRTLLDVTDTKGFGGVVIVISKATWRRVGGFVDGMLCVDHHMHFALREAGLKIYLLESLYVYHWRRGTIEGERQSDELPKTTPKAANCPCRGVEPMPTVRIALP